MPGQIEQRTEEAFEVSFGRRRQLNDEKHRPSFFRFASCLDCSLSSTVSTGTDMPDWRQASDAAFARASRAVWTRRKALAIRTVVSTASVWVSPWLSTGCASARRFRHAQMCEVRGFAKADFGPSYAKRSCAVPHPVYVWV